jgi:hypothetical protein
VVEQVEQEILRQLVLHKEIVDQMGQQDFIQLEEVEVELLQQEETQILEQLVQ